MNLRSALRALLPFLRWWPRVDRDSARADLVAGLTGALVLVPQGVAFATIAGMPPQYGLYAAMLPAIVAALWGSSWHLVSGPTTAISIVVFATISPLAAPETPQYVSLVLTLTLLVGVFQLLLGLLRLGTLVNFVSHTVVVGFTTGAAILIAASQVKNFFGIAIPRGASFTTIFTSMFTQLHAINPYVTAVAMTTLVACFATKRFWPRAPHMIVGMVTGSVVAAAINALAGGPSVTGVTSIGALSIGLPPLSHPDLSLETINTLVPIAIAVSMLALTEAVSISRAIALKTHQRIDGNQEFIGQGLSNMVGAFFSGYASSGSFNRSGLNYSSGAKTPLAAVFSAFILLGVMAFLSPLTAYLPTAAMAGILFVVAWGLIDVHHAAAIARASRPEAAVLLATLIATLTLQLEFAIYIGVLLSLMLYLNRTSRPPLQRVAPGQRGWPPHFELEALGNRLAVVRLHGPIFFGAINHLQEAFARIDEVEPERCHVLLLAVGVPFVDYAGAQLLAQEARRLQAKGGALYLHSPQEGVRETLAKTGAEEAIGADRIFDQGVDAARQIRLRLAAAQEQSSGPGVTQNVESAGTA